MLPIRAALFLEQHVVTLIFLLAAGVTQRVVRSAALASSTPSAQSSSAGRPNSIGGLASYAHAMLPLFQPLPESQPVLPCLLRRLLQQVRAPIILLVFLCQQVSMSPFPGIPRTPSLQVVLFGSRVEQGV